MSKSAGPLWRDYRCSSTLDPLSGPDGDAFRLRGPEERRGQSAEESEARWRAWDGNEDTDCLLLSWFICSWRGEVFVDQALFPQVRPTPRNLSHLSAVYFVDLNIISRQIQISLFWVSGGVLTQFHDRKLCDRTSPEPKGLYRRSWSPEEPTDFSCPLTLPLISP